MTSKLSRERLEKIKSWRETYGAGSNVILPAEEAEELARIALATMDGEPAAWTWHYREQWHVTNDERRAEFVAKDGDVAVLPLYRHAQPVPVVPDELNTRTANDVMNEHLSWKDYGDAEVFCIAWNACRAAMLHAGNSPAQSDCCPAQNHVSPEQNGDTPAQSQGWIPVSERMPEIGDIVLTAMGGVVNVGETECSAANCRFFTSVISGRELPATHWIAMPAAPQEVKGD